MTPPKSSAAERALEYAQEIVHVDRNAEAQRHWLNGHAAGIAQAVELAREILLDCDFNELSAALARFKALAGDPQPEPAKAQAPGAREWWIFPVPHERADNAFRQPFVNELGEIHVIEYAAYEALERALAVRTERVDDLITDLKQESEWHKQARAELAEAKREVEQSLELNQMSLLANAYELERQKAKSAALVEALKKIKSLAGLDSSAFGPRVVEIADEALKKYGETK